MKTFFLFCGLMVSLFSVLIPSARAQVHLDQIKLPPGFKISVFQENVKNARSMVYGTAGTLFVGSREAGNVYAITPKHELITLAKGLNMPTGIAFRDGALYVGEVARILKFADIEKNLKSPPKPEIIKADLPKETQHGWRYMSFGPDQKLYVAIGAPCNICNPSEPYAAIYRMDADGKNFEPYSRGIRNSVGFAWHPITHELWFTDNGRDMMGDDVPSDELNHAKKAGLDFGFPFCHEGSVLDPEFGKGKDCKKYTGPVEKLGAHVAALGMRFYTGKQFPNEYQDQIFIAEHGSWNRSKKSGYQIALVRLDAHGRSLGKSSFATGWLQDEKNWGRPAEVEVAADGSLLIADDSADVIYQISYSVAH